VNLRKFERVKVSLEKLEGSLQTATKGGRTNISKPRKRKERKEAKMGTSLDYNDDTCK
jgi:hypothetical protein